MTPQPLRTVTPNQKCRTCGRRFKPTRSDTRYCSGACRQRAARARSKLDELDRDIEVTRLRYWALIDEKAIALGASESQVVTDESQHVDQDGNVYMHGRLVAHTEPDRPGWAAWGLEAAGAPWSPPPAEGRA